MTNTATKILVGPLLDTKLKAIGIKGKYWYTDNDKEGNAAILSDIKFEDPKDRFIYELNGGIKLWDSVWDMMFLEIAKREERNEQGELFITVATQK